MILKKLVLLVLLLPISLVAQVGIGTTNPHSSSVLHIESSDKGLLVPQVALVDVTNTTTPVSSPKVGLLVWNTNDSVVGGAGKGFYFFKNNKWNNFGIPEAWSIKGNDGTNPGTNFLGTTDDKALTIKVNNLKRVQFETNGNITVSNTGGSVFLGDGAGAADNFISAGETNSNTFIGTSTGNKTVGSGSNGKSNVAVGRYSMENNVEGFNNVASGNQSMRYNFSGYENTAIGDYALKGDLDDTGSFAGTSYQNVAIGSNALQAMESGNNNVALGRNALNKSLNGNTNVAIGDLSGSENINGTGNVFIGNKSGKNEMGSNALYIDNSATVNPLIYGDFSANSLKINGTLEVTSGINVIGDIAITNDVNVTNDFTSNTIKVGTNGSVLTDVIRKKTPNFNLSNLASGASEIKTFAVANAPIDATVFVSPQDALFNGIVIAYARVSVAGTVEVMFINASTSSVNNTATKLNITVIK